MLSFFFSRQLFLRLGVVSIFSPHQICHTKSAKNSALKQCDILFHYFTFAFSSHFSRYEILPISLKTNSDSHTEIGILLTASKPISTYTHTHSRVWNSKKNPLKTSFNSLLCAYIVFLNLMWSTRHSRQLFRLMMWLNV